MSDTKLMDLDFRLQDVEATLSILEAKVIVAFLGNKALKIHITYKFCDDRIGSNSKKFRSNHLYVIPQL